MGRCKRTLGGVGKMTDLIECDNCEKEFPEEQLTEVKTEDGLVRVCSICLDLYEEN